MISLLNNNALNGKFDKKQFNIENKKGEYKLKSFSPVYLWFESKANLNLNEKKAVQFKCKICKPNSLRENVIYTTVQKFGKNGNLLKP